MMLTRQRSTILALSVEPDSLVVCRVRRRNDNIEIVGHWRFPVSAQMLRTDPARASAELRRHLSAVGLKREECVVCLPLAWAFTYRLEAPENLDDMTLKEYVDQQVEQRAQMAPDELQSVLLTQDAGGSAFFAGVPSEPLVAVEEALRAAGLKPVSMTLQGASLLQESPALDGVQLTLGPTSTDLAIAAGGQWLVLRNLLWAEQRGAYTNGDLSKEISRQLRITLGQLPSDWRDHLRDTVVYGTDTLPQDSRASIVQALARLGLQAREMPSDANGASHDVSADLLACARLCLRNMRPAVELLPKHVSKLQKAAARFSERRTRLMVIAAVGVVLLVSTAGYMQHSRLTSLETEWSAMEPRVMAVKAIQEDVRRYRSWYDTSVPTLAMASTIAQAFPEDGTVWVKALQIKDRVTVTCTGSAKSRADWMAVLERLRTSEGVANVQVIRAAGEAPFEFTMTLQWERSGGGGQ